MAMAMDPQPAPLASAARAPEPRVRSAPQAPAVAGKNERAFALLSSGSSQEVLARLCAGDPLELRPRVAVRCRARCLLLDPDAATTRAQAIAANRALSYRGKPALETWLDECVEVALDQLSVEPDAHPPAGIERTALVRFHRLPFEAREVFCAVVLDGQCLERLAAERGASVSELGRLARRALDALIVPENTERVRHIP